MCAISPGAQEIWSMRGRVIARLNFRAVHGPHNPKSQNPSPPAEPQTGAPAQPAPSAQPGTNPSPQQEPAPPPAAEQPQKPSTEKAEAKPAAPRSSEQEAWDLLDSACGGDNTRQRADAVRVLGLMPGDPKALKMAEKALTDEKPEVRAAAANALGEMKSRSSIPNSAIAAANCMSADAANTDLPSSTMVDSINRLVSPRGSL